MIDPKLSSQEKLPAAREMYQDAEDHFSDCNAERHRCARNYHNTGGNGQWDEDDKAYLEEERRPALTFNLIKRYIDTGIGMHMDMQREAVARPVGTEDRFLADVVEAICDRLDEESGTESVDADVLRDGYVIGEGDGHVDVIRDPKRPGWIKVCHYAASAYDVLWDAGSTKGNRTDASFVAYSRWLSESEFKQEYPEHADEWTALSEHYSSDPAWPFSAEHGSETTFHDRDDYARGNIYYDRHKKRARVVHLEYAVPVKRVYATINGESVAVNAEERALMERSWMFEGVEFSEPVWDEDIHAIVFIGTKVLYDSTEEDTSYQPFDGFSIVPFVYAMDTEENVPYGPVRNAVDPQGRLNKAFSILLEHLVGQHKPGYLHEKSAIKDIDSFEVALSQSGSTAEVEDGALVGGKVKERPMPQPSPAAQQQIEVSSEMLRQVFGFGNDLIQPAAQQEAATTVAIRYHKSQLSLADVRRSYDCYQREIKRRKIQAICRAMPDAQIAALLGNDEKYRVQNGMVMEVAPHPQMPGQSMVVRSAMLKDLRKVELNVELENTSSNTTLRRLELQTYMEAHQSQIPVDPRLIVEKMAGNRAEREQLLQYVDQAMQSQAEQQALQMKSMESAIGKQLQIEAGKVQETTRHNIAEEQLQAEKQTGDLAAKFAGIGERAEGAEKRVASEQYRALQQRIAAREAAMLKAQPRGSVQ